MEKIPTVLRFAVQPGGWFCFLGAVLAPTSLGKGPDSSVIVLAVCGVLSLIGVTTYLVTRRTVWRLVPDSTMFNTFAGFIYALPISWFFIGTLAVIWVVVNG